MPTTNQICCSHPGNAMTIAGCRGCSSITPARVRHSSELREHLRATASDHAGGRRRSRHRPPRPRARRFKDDAPDAGLPLAAQARHLADRAYALAALDKDDDAVDVLLALERLAPHWIRYQPYPTASSATHRTRTTRRHTTPARTRRPPGRCRIAPAAISTPPSDQVRPAARPPTDGGRPCTGRNWYVELLLHGGT